MISLKSHDKVTTPTSSKPNFEHGHPVGLRLHVLTAELEYLSTGEEDLEETVSTGPYGYNVINSNSVLENSSPWVKDK